MNIFLVKDGGVRSMQTSVFNEPLIRSLRGWRASGPNRMVYSISKQSQWYQLSDGGMWLPVPKPKVVEMAQLIGATPAITAKEIRSEISSDSFFAKR